MDLCSFREGLMMIPRESKHVESMGSKIKYSKWHLVGFFYSSGSEKLQLAITAKHNNHICYLLTNKLGTSLLVNK